RRVPCWWVDAAGTRGVASAAGGSRMSAPLSRRRFLLAAPAVPLMVSQSRPSDGSPGPSFPSHDPDLVREVVGASHGNLGRVKELVTARPALARVSWDW